MIVKLLTLLGGGTAGGKLAVLGIGAVALAMGGYIAYLNVSKVELEHKVAELQTQIASLEVDVERERGNVKECQARIELSNQRLDDLKSVTDERTKIIGMLSENIEVIKDASNARIQVLRNTVVGKSCEEAMQFLRDGVEDFKE